jgi:hypothetical protein
MRKQPINPPDYEIHETKNQVRNHESLTTTQQLLNETFNRYEEQDANKRSQ